MTSREIRFNWIRILDYAVESINMELGAEEDDELMDEVTEAMKSAARELRQRAKREDEERLLKEAILSR